MKDWVLRLVVLRTYISARGQISGTIVATLAALVLIAAPAAHAAPPANDHASGAELLAGTSFPVLSSTWSLTEATFSGDPITTCTSNDDHGIWFKITPNQTATYRIWATAAETATTVPDTVMGIFTSPDFTNFTEVACNDDAGGGTQSIVTTPLTAGTQYLIYVSQFGFGDPVEPPPNNVVQIKVDRIDNDSDGVLNPSDNCPNDPNPAQENHDADSQGDACDPDDDNDGVPDTSDACGAGVIGAGDDLDGDGCKSSEDPDDDDDGVMDVSDSCAAGAAAGPDTDGDGCKDDGEDPDDDNDTVQDATDECDLLGGDTSSGCPSATGAVTLKYSKRSERFAGKLTSDAGACAADRQVTVFKRKPGPDKEQGTVTTKPSGGFKLKKHASPGKYYVAGASHVVPDVVECAGATSETLKVG